MIGDNYTAVSKNKTAIFKYQEKEQLKCLRNCFAIFSLVSNNEGTTEIQPLKYLAICPISLQNILECSVGSVS